MACKETLPSIDKHIREFLVYLFPSKMLPLPSGVQLTKVRNVSACRYSKIHVIANTFGTAGFGANSRSVPIAGLW